MRACILFAAAAAVSGLARGQIARPSAEMQKQAALEVRSRIEASPKLPYHGVPLTAHCNTARCRLGSVSGVAIGQDGSIYEIQRGGNEPPVIVLDDAGRILQSWGEGNYTIPHSIHVDPSGNVWTVDAASSTVIKYSPKGERLMTLKVGEQPDNGSAFNGATDITFGPRGELFIADGYGNARVLVYSARGRKLRQWGRVGTGPGEFNLPHALRWDAGTIYVADRENGRIERFDPRGHFLGEIAHLGRLYDFAVTGQVLWASMGPFDQPPGAAGGWVVKLDRQTGQVLGHLDVLEAHGGHALDLMPSGEPIITLGDHLLWFKAD